MRWGAPLGAAIMISLFGAPSLAQPAPRQPPSPGTTPQAPAIEMPRPLTPLVAEYPKDAEGDASVIVKLVIERDGSVVEASVAEGREPFASAALAAAKSFRFAPAKRDGAPIRAAIRAEVKFTAPRPLDATGPDGLNTTAAPDAGRTGTVTGAPPLRGTASPPIDVSVKGIIAPPGATSMSRAEVRLLPGAFGDPFRAVEALPGVTPIASGIPYFFVRGAPPGNVGYFLDGIRVPLLYHLGLGPSVVHPNIVDRVDLYPGGYPARFGRFAGAIVAGETREPRPELNGEAQIRLVDAGAMVEAPFAGGRGSALAGGRYSYTGLLFSILQSNLRLDYWDYQARISYDISPTETLTLFAFGARDYLGDNEGGGDAAGPCPDGEADCPTMPPPKKERTLVDTTFHRVDARYDKKLGPDSTFRHALTFGWDETAFEGGSTRDILIADRTELRLPVGSTAVLRGGTNATLDAIQTTLKLSDIGSQVPISLSPRHDFAGGIWADLVWSVTDRLEVTPGLRVDLYGSTGGQGGAEIAVEPRLSAALHLLPWLRMVQAHGLSTQRPSFFLPGPGFTPDFSGGLQKSLQTSAGVEVDLPLEMEGKALFFRNAFFDMTDAFGASTFTDFITPEEPNPRTMGSSIGMELSLRRRMTKRIGGFLSYTLSRSERQAGRSHLRSGTDRTHVLNAALGVDIGRGFRAGTRFVFYTGFPDIQRERGRRGERTDTGRELDPFFRLDLRMEKRWSISRTRWISIVLEMQNATLSKETLGVRCDDGKAGERVCEPIQIGPVSIPSIGVEGGI